MNKTLVTIVVIALIVCAGLGYWAYGLWNEPVGFEIDFKPLTPEERSQILDDLELSSQSPASTTEVREAQIEELEKASVEVKQTKEERIDLLKQLEASSKK